MCRRLLKHNPLDGADVPKPGKRKRVLSDTELVKVYRGAEVHGYPAQLTTMRLPTGTEVAAVFHTDKAARSQSQLAYHWVLPGYLSDHTGHTPEELHDYVMRAVFGEKSVPFGNQTFAVRRSMGSSGRMTKEEAAQVIEHDLQLCQDNGVVIPTKEEPAYISNH